MLLIFDTSQGYPAPCIGRHDIETDDPVRVTENPDAVGVPDVGFEDEPHHYLVLSDHPDNGGVVSVDATRMAEEGAETALRGGGLLGLVVAVGAINHVVRTHTPGLSPLEDQALEIVADALPDVSTLRTLLARPGLAADLRRAKTILEGLAGS